MNNFSNPNRVAAGNNITSAANTAGTGTFTPDTGRSVVIGGFAFSYSGGESDISGRITIIDEDDVTYYDHDITSAGYGNEKFEPPMMFPVGKAVTVTIAAAGADVIGKLSFTAIGQQ